ncbi:hypothetical protein QQF64_003963 [Cirrhinus molitorella]|uniref:Uncharacterized protein n=1 Tax=Cirrhinus molitorella TaxID=172907 RepID=A0ABR3MMS6_9TELE
MPLLSTALQTNAGPKLLGSSGAASETEKILRDEEKEGEREKRKGESEEILYLISKPMLARGRPVSWARLSQPFLKQSEGFGLDTESPRDAPWHFPHAEDIRAEGEREREGERRICP